MKKMIMIVAMMFGLSQIGFGQDVKVLKDSANIEVVKFDDNVSVVLDDVMNTFVYWYVDIPRLVRKTPAGWVFSDESRLNVGVYKRYSDKKLEVVVVTSDCVSRQLFSVYYQVRQDDVKESETIFIPSWTNSQIISNQMSLQEWHSKLK